MKAQAGDWLVIKGAHVDQADQRGLITEVHGADGAPPYVVRWLATGHVATVIPGPDAVVVTAAEQKAADQRAPSASKLSSGIMTEKSENTMATATTPSAEKTAAAERAERVSHVVERAAELSDEVLESVQSGGRAAIGAVRKFVDTVDEALPPAGDHPPRRKTIVDAAGFGRSTGHGALRLHTQRCGQRGPGATRKARRSKARRKAVSDRRV
jgi:Domain of unknown function (DUF1918)